ncbi:unnamed protein product, partial [Amoebophrya sp. A25]
ESDGDTLNVDLHCREGGRDLDKLTHEVESVAEGEGALPGLRGTTRHASQFSLVEVPTRPDTPSADIVVNESPPRESSNTREQEDQLFLTTRQEQQMFHFQDE